MNLFLGGHSDIEVQEEVTRKRTGVREETPNSHPPDIRPPKKGLPRAIQSTRYA